MNLLTINVRRVLQFHSIAKLVSCAVYKVHSKILRIKYRKLCAF